MIWLDFETRSECNLKAHGAYTYAQHPSTQVLCMAWAIDDGEVELWTPDQPFPQAVKDAVQNLDTIRAHNAAFERLIFWYVLCPDYDVPEPKLEQFYCTAAQARSNCMPGSLEDAGRFAGASMKKDHKGAALVRKCCIPPFKHTEQDLLDLFEYCRQDVRAMRAVSQSIRQLSAVELADYHVNERINDRGVRVDIALANAAMGYAAQELRELTDSVRALTEGAVTTIRSPALRAWVLERLGPEARKLAVRHKDGESKDSLDKTVRANLLAFAEENPDEVPSVVAEVIQATDDVWASSTAKFGKLVALADSEDARVRGAFVFAGGAATGRACVSAGTMVSTEFGRVPISALKIGERVLTHTGRLCKVSRVIYKGRQMMYRISVRSGGCVECTEEHRLLTAKGWKSVKELICYTRRQNARGNHTPVYVAALPYDGRSCSHDESDARNRQRNRAGDGSARSVKDPQSGELLEIEDGREEPYVWGEETSRSGFEAGLSVSVGGRGRRVCTRTSLGAHARAWLDGMAGWLGSASHRQRQNEQLIRQLGNCDESWASTVALSEITEVICLGEKGVWDISVEGDASYVAQGLIHHNSSYGAQVHNIPRKAAKRPLDIRDAMMRREALVPTHGKRVTDVLKLMLRPTLVPADGHVFVVADWSAIEGRVNPWLADSPKGQDKLKQFADGLDAYIVNASATFGRSYAAILADHEAGKSDERQIGKVQELSCGFGGGVGAFASMARVYGVHLPEPTARRMVQAWRAANGWAPLFWSDLELAYISAMLHPGSEYTAGRVTYMFDGQHLWYILPSERVLCYPYARRERDGSVTYAKASWKPSADAKEWPRGKLWPGLACENSCQSTAHDVLREALRVLDGVVLHVHDEIVLEVPEGEADAAAARLVEVMRTPPAWAGGLPLDCEVKIMGRYGK